MADEGIGRDWKCRPPPRGFTSETYALCESWEKNRSCQYGAQCVEAHGIDELSEWKERFEYRKMKMQRACEKELYGKNYTEQLLEKWVQATSPEKVMREKLDCVKESCSTDLVTTVSSKISKREWDFVLITKQHLKAVALLQDAHRNHFSIKQIIPGDSKYSNKKGRDGSKLSEIDLISDQEWVISSSERSTDIDRGPVYEHHVKIFFSTDIYGTFRQSVVFDFGTEPVLVKHLCVDVVPVTDADKIKEIRKEIILSSNKRWDSDNSDIVPFSSPVYPGLATPYGKEACDRDRELLGAYPAPRASTLCLTQSTVSERSLTKNNYRTRMHELLYVEELARCEQVARYNLTCKLRVAPSYLLAPSGMANSTAKYAHSGELFALLTLGKDVSEDTSAGRLILNNCNTVLLASSNPPPPGFRRRVYEALIEDKGKNMVYLRLSAVTVRELGMRADTDFSADIQFQLNRLTYCEWHYAIDRITDYRLIFPDTTAEFTIPWSTNRQWDDTLDFRLNVKQKEAVLAITTPTGVQIPPILIIGPFGTGKTYTLAQAMKKLLVQPESKILICTHSNSAADLYIKDYLHPWLEAGVTDARPLRIYYHKRWVTTVDDIVQQYCLIDINGGIRSFQLPTLDDVLKHRVVVVTLSISMCLSTLGLPKGYFTHILLDEAAQAMESEALMPLAMATPITRIVLAGDHMQLSPELFSQFAKERNLHISLLERLYEHYPANFPCKILLCENYRAHEAIINFTSELFYEQMLIASGKQPSHNKFYPLTFFTTRGEDVQDQNSTAFYNNSEVYEVVERVHELRMNWPTTWGKLDEQSIGIMTPYADQVFRIRSELRKRRMGGISVERVLNVQGKQFRAIFLSTVRTRRTCQAALELDYGFLSNRKLLNTAITRAQSLVAVVGDPVALCSIGRCRKVWERFINICHENNSLFGITWSLLRSQLDGIELRKTYTLNPLAPEFVPRAMQSEAYIRYQLNDNIPPPLIQPSPAVNMPISIPQMNSTIIRHSNSAQMPTLINPNNQPLITYPLFVYPSNTNQHPPHPTEIVDLFSIPRHQAPQAIAQISNIPNQVYNTVNPWTTNSFPLTSPNDLTTSPWSKQISKKPPEISSIIAPPLQNLQRIAPSHFAGTSTSFINPQIIPNKNSQFIPMPPNLTHFGSKTPSNPLSAVSENFIPNEAISPAVLRNGPITVPSERAAYSSLVNKIQEANFLNIVKEKEQIQFLQNVHFPERINSVNSGVRDAQSVVPLNINIHDICNESREVQLRWYRHLLDTQGADVANKFMEIIIHKKSTISPIVKPPVHHFDPFIQNSEVIRNIDNVYSEKVNLNNKSTLNYNIPNGHGLLAPVGDLQRSWPLSEPKPSLSSHYVNSKPFLKEFESLMTINNGIYNQSPVHNDDKFLNQRVCIPNDPLEVPWPTNKSAQSVPLYRRQAGQSSNSTSQSDAPKTQELLDILDKSNSSAGAFAGYARAFSQQNEPFLSHSQHGSVMTSERSLINGSIRLPDYHNTLRPSLSSQPNLRQQTTSDFANPLNGTSFDNSDGSDNITYASILRQNTPKLDDEKSEPISILQGFGHKSQTQGLYHYFN